MRLTVGWDIPNRIGGEHLGQVVMRQREHQLSSAAIEMCHHLASLAQAAAKAVVM